MWWIRWDAIGADEQDAATFLTILAKFMSFQPSQTRKLPPTLYVALWLPGAVRKILITQDPTCSTRRLTASRANDFAVPGARELAGHSARPRTWAQFGVDKEIKLT